MDKLPYIWYNCQWIQNSFSRDMIKTFVINLKKRQDRLDLFDKTNKINYARFEAFDGSEIDYTWLKDNWYDTDKEWVDPFLNTQLTHGEVGCFLSHYKLWIKCLELGEPILVLEDDAILTEKFSIEKVSRILSEGYNFLYLGWLEMNEDGSLPINDELVRPVYPYWALAYALTPEAASILVNHTIRNNIIPVDEYLPNMIDSLKVCAYIENVVIPHGREITGTNIHPVDRYQYFLDFKTHAITVGSDDSKCEKLHYSAERYGFKFKNIGDGVSWNGTDMSGPGGGQKINLLKTYIESLPDTDVILFCDGYDVFVANNLDEITRRYLEFKTKILFAAEENCWPEEDLASSFPDTSDPYKYLNSGLFIGRVGEIKKLISDPILDHEDDQLYYQKRFLSKKYDIKLDTESYIFQCHDFSVVVKYETLFNPKTNCFSCIYHGNGGDAAKKKFNSIYNSIFGKIVSNINYLPTYNYEKLDDEMLLVDFMTPSMCDELIKISDEHGGWGSLSYDKFPAQEIRVKELGMWEEMEKHWEKYLYPIVEKFWTPMEMYGLRDAFVMRYALNTQTSLKLHNDASLVTGSVKLNDDYEGADLFFPRQNITNEDVPVGKCILFPGQVTHGHTCRELVSGVKYSLTMWTSRYPGDKS